ncbi:hypothetical protein [Microbacterium thalli]|uniref:hypothetical protein n=1 Tax=Microbacterium thalli TaxID=3027921 RepID=UPI002366F6B8|nr:hypothetical protein [Microbacterium thalli]MDD7930109.1 hypothetical protein [Microbacterium thalli]
MSAEFSPVQVQAMFQREGGACFYCRRPLAWEHRAAPFAGGWSAHHRIDRGNGGRGKKATVTCADGLILCGTGTTGCHGAVSHDKTRAIELGLSIPRLARGPEFDPLNVAATRKDGTKVVLTADGGAVEVEQKTWA